MTEHDRALAMRFALLLTLLLTAACGDHDPAAPGLWDVADVYGVGSMQLVSAGDTTDLTADTYGTLWLATDSTMMALLYVDGFIEGEHETTVLLEGTWELDGSVVTLDHEPETFLDGIELRYDDDTLVGVADVDAGRILIELEKAEPDEAVGR